MTVTLIDPIVVNDGVLASSNWPEDDHPAWSSAATYVVGARVILTSTHRIYESTAASNTNRNPVTAGAAWWVEVGATGRWKVFDGQIGDTLGTTAQDLSWTLTVPEAVDTVGFFGLLAGTVGIAVFVGGTNIVNVTKSVVGSGGFESKAILTGAFIPAGATLIVSVRNTGSGPRVVGEIVVGTARVLGEALDGCSSSLVSYSRKERDEFGNLKIIRRRTAAKATYLINSKRDEIEGIKTLLARLESTMVVVTAGDIAWGLTVFGTYGAPDFPIAGHDEVLWSLPMDGQT